MTDNLIDTYARILFDYHFLKQTIKKADCIFVLGSHDPSVADYASQLYHNGMAPFIIFSGGVVRPAGELRNTVPKTEAEAFFDIAVKKGVPPHAIILENEATNTGENFIFTKKLIQAQQLNFGSFILVQKPYMIRRTYATAMVQFKEFDFVVSAIADSYDTYLSRCAQNGISKERVISNMTGDLQRLKIYPERGFLIPMDIPEEVWNAYEKLIEAGYEGRMAS
ncbi:YdcF family protein [Emticicia sp. 21SJ11W-3]|uniref:YdcF family protein n=1 Tax=Emticicia sp. 21SJ11W-3 TaxID=2916755 RepID=UPI0020A183E1|nr:YdcF family protein [Emticicia sp. 21SJ11W-3]UTA68524.1 YdcF family protein [Emticicia sp. 21SJ11W-3]